MSYLPIRLSTLKRETAFGFDVYIKLPHKHLLYIRKEDFLDQSRIKTLKERKVRKLFIEDSDESLYQAYIDGFLKDIMKDDSLSNEDRSSYITASCEASVERMYSEPGSEGSFNAAKSTTSNLIKVLGESEEILKNIFNSKVPEDMDSIESRMHKHSVNTSSLVISFAEFLGMPAPDIELLGVAALFHDIAFTDYAEEKKGLFCSDISLMASSDLVLYREHPTISAKLLEGKDFISAGLVDLIVSHEEKRGGSGFPNKLQKLTQSQEILSMCAYFDREVTCLNISKSEVIDNFHVDQLGNYDLDLIKKFKNFIKKSGI